MTDKEKLDKLVAEIKRLRKEVKDNIAELGNSESERIGLFKDLEIYDNILSLIDSMQEKPKECMYSKDNYTDEDRKVLCEGCEEECKFNKKEEPVRIKKGCKYRCLSDMQNIDTGAISFFKDKIYSAPEDNTLVSEENGWLCDISENSSNFELVEEPVSKDFEMALAEMIDKAQKCVVEPLVIAEQWKDELIKLAKSKELVSKDWVKELRAKLDSLSKEDFKKVFDKYVIDFNVEPASEDLEKEIDEYISILTERRGDFPKLTKLGFRTIARHFANWQKQKDSIPVSENLEEAGKEWLKPQLDKSYANYGEAKMMELTHFDGYAMLDAIEFGANWKEQQMIKKAFSVEIGKQRPDYKCVLNGNFFKYDTGDKVKVIVIKED